MDELQNPLPFTRGERNAGINTILATDKSTALMSGLLPLQEDGCRIIGLRTFTRMEDSWHGLEDVEVRGIEAEIP